MNTRERVFTIIGMMQCVTDMVHAAHRASGTRDLAEAYNACQNAVYVASSWASGGGTDKECVARNARVILDTLGNLSDSSSRAEVHLWHARKFADELKPLTE